MGLRDKTAPTLTTPLIRANKSYDELATIFSSLAFLPLSMANLSCLVSCLVAASFSSLAHLSSSVSTANLSCLLATTFSNLSFLSNSLSSPRFNLLRVARRCFLWLRFLIFASYPQPFFPLSSDSEASFPFLSERFFFVYAKAALACSLN